MTNYGNLPRIDTTDFEIGLSPEALTRFKTDRLAFVKLIYRLIVELGLQGHIDDLSVGLPSRGRAELYRDPENPWPSRHLNLEIYRDRYMDERLLRHELGHEADRHNPAMLYDPAIEARWKGRAVIEVAANISLDARLGERGLGKDRRRGDFREAVGEGHDNVFEQAWANPPRTWPEIEELAARLAELLGEDVPPR